MLYSFAIFCVVLFAIYTNVQRLINYKAFLMKCDAIDTVFCEQVKYEYDKNSYHMLFIMSFSLIAVSFILAIKYLGTEIFIFVDWFGNISFVGGIFIFLKAKKIQSKLYIYRTGVKYFFTFVKWKNIDIFKIHNGTLIIRAKNSKYFRLKIKYSSDVKQIEDVIKKELNDILSK